MPGTSTRRGSPLRQTLHGALSRVLSARASAPAATELLDALFAPPTAEEIAHVAAEWTERDTEVHGYRIDWRGRSRAEARTLVVSHTVEGIRHYGAVRIPGGAAGRRHPVLVLAHGGDHGATPYEFFRSGPIAEGWIQVVPSFRSERLIMGPLRWHRSEGPPSPWDRDVDDTMALLSAVLARVPEADGSRVAVLGRSRGAGVALLMGIRDPRVRTVVSFAAPTDFFLPQIRALAERALRSQLPRLPGAGYLANTVLFPLRNGRLPLAHARQELLRRSPAWFARGLPSIQLHHGTADGEVPVAHGDRLAEALRQLGEAEVPLWEYHRYDAGGHGPETLRGSEARAVAFVQRLSLSHTVADPARMR